MMDFETRILLPGRAYIPWEVAAGVVGGLHEKPLYTLGHRFTGPGTPVKPS